jgi:hypothetical protein
MVKKMKKEAQRKRPNCDKILGEKNQWALSKEELKNENQFISFEESFDKNSDVYNFLKIKDFFT